MVASPPPPTIYATDTTIVNNTNIAAWGDSLTAGTGSTGINGDYPNKLGNLSGYTVYNGGVGGDTSTQIKVRMLADTARYVLPTVIWAGRNNYTSPSTVMADIAAMVAALGHTNYIILSILNGEFGIEYTGQSGYNQIVGINASLASLYGAHYIDVRSYLVSQHNGTAQDLIDLGHDIVPASLRFDSIHLTSAGYALVAAQVYAQIAQLQHDGVRVLAERRLPALLGAPPTIGQKTPATIYAGRVYFSAGSQTEPSLCGSGLNNNDTGIYWPNSNAFYTVANGSAIFNFSVNFQALTPHGVFIPGGVPTSSTLPTLVPDNTAQTTGLGAASAGVLSFIIAAVEAVRITAARVLQANAGIQCSGSSGATWRSGTGDPNGAVTGSVGDLWSRTDGGTGTSFYVKESGAATTSGWVGK